MGFLVTTTLEYLALLVRDYDEAIAYYTKVLGFSLLEALEAWDRPEAGALITRLATADASPVVRVYGARILLQLQLRLGEGRGRVALLELAVELLERLLAPLGGVGSANDVGYRARFPREPQAPHEHAADEQREHPGDRFGDPRRQREGDHPHRRRAEADAQADLLQVLA